MADAGGADVAFASAWPLIFFSLCILAVPIAYVVVPRNPFLAQRTLKPPSTHPASPSAHRLSPMRCHPQTSGRRFDRSKEGVGRAYWFLPELFATCARAAKCLGSVPAISTRTDVSPETSWGQERRQGPVQAIARWGKAHQKRGSACQLHNTNAIKLKF